MPIPSISDMRHYVLMIARPVAAPRRRVHKRTDIRFGDAVRVPREACHAAWHRVASGFARLCETA